MPTKEQSLVCRTYRYASVSRNARRVLLIAVRNKLFRARRCGMADQMQVWSITFLVPFRGDVSYFCQLDRNE